MDVSVPFGSRAYLVFLGVLLVARGLDFLSTWVATPHLVLEGNPIAKRLGWKLGGVVNGALCLVLASLPLAALIVATTSLLVAARNFQGAWLMRTMGEHAYRAWMTERLAAGRTGLFLFCLFAQFLILGGLGAALAWWGYPLLVPLGVGLGLVGYALAVLVFTLLSLRRR